MATQWFFQDGGQVQGPVAFRDLVELVRAGAITQPDLVRSSWTSEWQRADSVVGLFYMAGRFVEDPACDHAPDAPTLELALIEPIDDLPIPDAEERPSWMKRLFEVGDSRMLRPAEIPVLRPTTVEPLEAHGSADARGSMAAAAAIGESHVPDPAENAFASNSMGDVWSATVAAAMDRVGERSVKHVSSRRTAGFIASMPRIARLLAPVSRFGRSAALGPAFRIICAFICANLVALGVEAWSNQELLRFPSRDGTSLRPLPFVGPCSTGEYVFLVFSLMLASGAAAYFAAAWLESRAE